MDVQRGGGTGWLGRGGHVPLKRNWKGAARQRKVRGVISAARGRSGKALTSYSSLAMLSVGGGGIARLVDVERKWRLAVGGWAKTSNVECDDRGEMERCGSLKRVSDFSGMQAKRRRCWLWTSWSRSGSLGGCGQGQDKAHVPFFSLTVLITVQRLTLTSEKDNEDNHKDGGKGWIGGHEEPSS